MDLREPSAKYLVEPPQQTAVGPLPADWRVRPLSTLAEIRSGIAKNANSQVSNPIAVHYLRVANVQDGYLDLSDMSQLTVSREDIQRYAVLPGDMLMNEGGDLDKLGRGALWDGSFSPCVHQNHVFVVRAGRALVPGYLKAWTASSAARRYFLVAGKQTTNLASINKTSLGEMPVALPPSLDEQQAIAAALTDADALIESLEQLLAKKRQIKQGAMQELLTGQRRLPGFSGDWTAASLADLATFHKGRGLPKSQLMVHGPRPCIHYGELFTRYPATIREVLSRTGEAVDCPSSEANDVLMPTSDVTPRGLAKASCVMQAGVAIGGDILVIRPDPQVLVGSFLSHMVRHEEAQVLRLVTGSTVFHLYAADMKRFEFRLPSTEEQRAIVEVIDSMEAEIEALDAKLTKARHLKQAMMQALLTGRIRLASPAAATAGGV